MSVRNWFRILCAVATLAVLACEKTPDPEPVLPPADISLTLTEVEVEYKADSQAILKVTSSLDWKAEGSDAWIKPTPTSGKAGKAVTLHIKVSANPDTKPRVGSVTITSGSSKAVIKVTQKAAPVVLTPDQVQDYERIYVPKEHGSHCYLQSDAEWYFGRSRQSEHFILFWAKDYGDVTPDQSPAPYQVNTADVLSFLEGCFKTYTQTLGFADIGQGKSYLDKYKMMVYLVHDTNWKAEGFGYDNVIGCFWVNPDACNGHFTIAHEIGHSFQYQVYCDQLYNKQPDNERRGWRYPVGPNGCGFWEQTSQWQASIVCPDEALTDWQLPTLFDNAHRHILHEDMRYGSYMIHRDWTDRYGMDAVGRVWRSSAYPDDAIQAYQKLFGLSLEELNNQLYEYAAHCATWDFGGVREAGVKHLNKISWKGSDAGNGYYMVDPSRALEATGFNIIRLNVEPGQEISADFVGLPNQKGFNSSGDATVSGWKMGFVSLGSDLSTRTYSEHATASHAGGNKASLKWTVPADAQYVWAVVSCTPTTYISHGWDDNNANDRHWPYKIRFMVDGKPYDMTAAPSGELEGAGAGGSYAWSLSGSTISVTVDINMDEAASRGAYEVGYFELPVDKVNAFIGADVRELDESSFTCYNPDGTKVDMTSYKPGMWVDIKGEACSWSVGTAFWQWYVWGGKKDKDGNKIWYDGDPDGTGANQGRFYVGVHPDHVAAAKGKTITFRNKIAAKGSTFDFTVTYNFK